MLFDLPDLDLPGPDALYDALLARDPSFEGRAFVGVASTGVFCRLTCPARKPRRENCAFFPTPAACLEAGYRPCLRCRPLGGDGPLVAGLLAAVAADPGRRWREADLVARGYDPSTVRRAFRRSTGMTFLEMVRLRRLAEAGRALARGARVIDAQIEAGFESPSAFRSAFARLMGQAPGALPADARLRADWIATPLGPMVAVADERALHLLEFADRRALPAELARLRQDARGDLGLGRTPVTELAENWLSGYFAGHIGVEVPLAGGGTPFQALVWAALREIPPGRTVTYAALAARIGRPDAVRAVARANGAHRIALLIPCHRVIGADGGLTGYGGGLWRKERLIALERGLQGGNGG
jgi:AraC family transcriptional regulator, regulatory protein of adaptative response / methylated-DNA-[protein]-cysteine methyltransferase